MASILESRRADTKGRLDELRSSLTEASKLAKDRACVYLTGSFARGEAAPHSDLDLFIAGREKDNQRALTRLDEICIKADLIEASRRHAIPEFSGDGEYLVHYTVRDLVQTLGKPQDDASNTFTARLLLLLESRPLIGEDVYSEAIENVIAKYWRDYSDHKTDFVPAFLANDILRLWRTFCVNYEARTSVDPPEKKAKRKLKNFKLKHSRLLTCYSGLVYLLGTFVCHKTVSPKDAVDMVARTPTERLEWLGTEQRLAKSRDKVKAILDLYDQFLGQTGEPEETLVQQFLDPAKSGKFFKQANDLGDRVYELLNAVGDGTPLYRHLVV